MGEDIVRQKNDDEEDKVVLKGRCGFECWCRWRHNFIFCKHDRQMCASCGEIWLRFAEPSHHKTARGESKCQKKVEDKLSRILNNYG